MKLEIGETYKNHKGESITIIARKNKDLEYCMVGEREDGHIDQWSETGTHPHDICKGICFSPFELDVCKYYVTGYRDLIFIYKKEGKDVFLGIDRFGETIWYRADGQTVESACCGQRVYVEATKDMIDIYDGFKFKTEEPEITEVEEKKYYVTRDGALIFVHGFMNFDFDGKVVIGETMDGRIDYWYRNGRKTKRNMAKLDLIQEYKK